MTVPLWTLRDVSVRLRTYATDSVALQSISLRIDAGERIALVGSNGCGKSTLLRTLAGLLSVDDGGTIAQTPARHGLLAQTPHLLRLSVLNNIRLALWLRGTPWRASREPALRGLRALRLDDLAMRSATQLSVGQLQRVALAQCLVVDPDVLLLDEPTASLDPHAKQDVERIITDFVAEQPAAASLDRGVASLPKTVVFASHNLGQVKRLATRVLYMEGGRVLVDLPVDDFFNEALMATQAESVHLFLRGELL